MNNSYTDQSVGQDMLSEFEVNLVQAGAGKRFANYIIDVIVVMVVTMLVLFIFYSIVGFPEQNPDDGFTSLLQTIIYSLIFGVIYGLIEGIFKGKSLGKLITGTRAVNANGTPISFKTALLRGISRVVPFEPFSALGSPSYPWHDKWTSTYVVDEKQSSLPRVNQ